jgi:serine protease Do
MRSLLALAMILAAPAQADDLQARILRVQAAAESALVNIQPTTESFTRGERRKQASVGSGFLIDTDGHVVTNFHVAGKATRLVVTLWNEERVEAELVGEDPLTDLAVIKLPAGTVATHKMKPLPFGDSEALAAGEFVMALGSPLALSRTMTFGVVSNNHRYLQGGMTLPSGERTGEFNTWIQTDAAINPGNSGGPLVDLDGAVVGVNARGAMLADNIGFAIPARVARRVAADLIASGEVHRSFVGIDFQPLQDWYPLFGLDAPRGVLVGTVIERSPADAAGLRAGDIVLRWGGTDLTVRFDEEMPDLYSLIADTAVGTTVPITVLRDGREIGLSVRTIETGAISGERYEAEVWGFTVQQITDQMAFERDLDGRDGVLVEGVRVGGPAARAELGVGWVVTHIDDEPIADLAAFRAKLGAVATKPEVLLRLRAHERVRIVLIRTGAGR